MTEQLDLFHQPDEPAVEPVLDDVTPAAEQPPRRTELTELPGTTFEDIFAGPPSRTRTAA